MGCSTDWLGGIAAKLHTPVLEEMQEDAASDVQSAGDSGRGTLPGLLRRLAAMHIRQSAETEAALTDGWMRSGDVGFMDADGWFYLVDRKKDCIIASGFKVWPREVEDALHAHPAVREAAVVGAPDAYRGETVIAHVSLRTGSDIDEASLIAHCRSQLAAYKVPRIIRIAVELPKTATGKIQRNVLRDAETARAAEAELARAAG